MDMGGGGVINKDGGMLSVGVGVACKSFRHSEPATRPKSQRYRLDIMVIMAIMAMGNL